MDKVGTTNTHMAFTSKMLQPRHFTDNTACHKNETVVNSFQIHKHMVSAGSVPEGSSCQPVLLITRDFAMKEMAMF